MIVEVPYGVKEMYGGCRILGGWTPDPFKLAVLLPTIAML
jgi:hypothetical protein